jgi:hypothetical protein
MKITCIDSMGYIYLKPHESSSSVAMEHNTLSDYVNPEQMKIPYSTNEQLSAILDQIPLFPNTFKTEQGKSYETEYGNDLDEQGYLNGIELTLTSERFIELISQQTIQIIKTHWRNEVFHLIAFDHMDNVLHPDNHIYKLTDAEDAFVIVYLEKPENLGYFISDGQIQPPIALFRAFLTARDDIYPLEYLLKPEFILLKSEIEEVKKNAADIGWRPRLNDCDVTPEMKELLDQIFGKSENG